MKSKAVLLGHPAHPMLIPFPFAFLTGAFLFDVAGWLRGVSSWWTTGAYLSLAGVATPSWPLFLDSSTTSIPCRRTVRRRHVRPGTCSRI